MIVFYFDLGKEGQLISGETLFINHVVDPGSGRDFWRGQWPRPRHASIPYRLDCWCRAVGIEHLDLPHLSNQLRQGLEVRPEKAHRLARAVAHEAELRKEEDRRRELEQAKALAAAEAQRAELQQRAARRMRALSLGVAAIAFLALVHD